MITPPANPPMPIRGNKCLGGRWPSIRNGADTPAHTTAVKQRQASASPAVTDFARLLVLVDLNQRMVSLRVVIVFRLTGQRRRAMSLGRCLQNDLKLPDGAESNSIGSQFDVRKISLGNACQPPAVG